uniref:Uncharacterized protein n=1 Tax=Alexandrium monilatum TaxID=311494 RepID=A0A7S4R3Q6_9DINO
MPSCNTSWATRFNCSGRVTKCNGCGDAYCDYHQPGCKSTRVRGGHACSRPCSTTNMPIFVANCSGALAKCPHCKDMYCSHHHEANRSDSQACGGHVCEAYTQKHLNGAVRAAAGATAGLVQAVANRFGVRGRYEAEVSEGLRVHDKYSRMATPRTVGKGCRVVRQGELARVFPYCPMVEQNGTSVPRMWVELQEIIGSRMCPVDIDDMMECATTQKVVIVSMNWSFVDERAYQKRLELFAAMVADEDYRDHAFMVYNDQVGEAMGTSYCNEVDPFRSEKYNSEVQRQWVAWFIGMCVSHAGVCIAQPLPDGTDAVSENTAREFLAMSSRKQARSDFQLSTYGNL